MPYSSPLDLCFVDVSDLQAEAARLDFACGMLPPPPDSDLDLYAGVGDVMELIPESRWESLIREIDGSGDGWLERYIKDIFNQGREPSCVYNAAGQAAEICWNRQFGLNNAVPLSAISGYRENGTPRSGSSVPGALDWMRGVGLLPADCIENRVLAAAGHFPQFHLHPRTGYSVNPGANWRNTSRLFRADEWLRIRSVAEWFTALFAGCTCIGGRDGHCIVHVRPVMISGKPASCYANSWGVAWGATLQISGSRQTRGFGYDSRAKVATMCGRGAWALRTMLVPPWLAIAG